MGEPARSLGSCSIGEPSGAQETPPSGGPTAARAPPPGAPSRRGEGEFPGRGPPPGDRGPPPGDRGPLSGAAPAALARPADPEPVSGPPGTPGGHGPAPPPARSLTGPRCVLTVVAMVLRRPAPRPTSAAVPATLRGSCDADGCPPARPPPPQSADGHPALRRPAHRRRVAPPFRRRVAPPLPAPRGGACAVAPAARSSKLGPRDGGAHAGRPTHARRGLWGPPARGARPAPGTAAEAAAPVPPWACGGAGTVQPQHRLRAARSNGTPTRFLGASRAAAAWAEDGAGTSRRCPTQGAGDRDPSGADGRCPAGPSADAPDRAGLGGASTPCASRRCIQETAPSLPGSEAMVLASAGLGQRSLLPTGGPKNRGTYL